MTAIFSFQSFSVRFSSSILLSFLGRSTRSVRRFLDLYTAYRKRADALKIVQMNQIVRNRTMRSRGSSMNHAHPIAQIGSFKSHAPTAIAATRIGQKKKRRNGIIVFSLLYHRICALSPFYASSPPRFQSHQHPLPDGRGDDVRYASFRQEERRETLCRQPLYGEGKKRSTPRHPRPFD